MLLQKYFIPHITDIPGNILDLRKKFPGFHFKNGMHKGVAGAWCLSSLEKIDNAYGDPIPSKQHKDATYFPPKDIPQDIQKFLDSRKKKLTKPIKVDLVSGVSLMIHPATAEPRKVIFSLVDEIEESTNNVSPYAKLAFELFDQLDKGELKNNDKRVMQLLWMAIDKSYDGLSIDLVNWLGIFTFEDIETVFYAAIGINPEEIKKNEVTSS